MPEIRGKPVLVHASDNRAVWIIKKWDLRESPMYLRYPWNIWHAKYLELSAIPNPAVWMSSDWKIHGRWPYSQWETKIQVSDYSLFTTLSVVVLCKTKCLERWCPCAHKHHWSHKHQHTRASVIKTLACIQLREYTELYQAETWASRGERTYTVVLRIILYRTQRVA